MNTLIQRTSWAVASILVLHLAGCASPASHEGMTAEAVAVSKKLIYQRQAIFPAGEIIQK